MSSDMANKRLTPQPPPRVRQVRRNLHPQRDSFLLPVAPAAVEESLEEEGERAPEGPQAVVVQEAPREGQEEVEQVVDRGVEVPRA
jgi:hypothetical protein